MGGAGSKSVNALLWGASDRWEDARASFARQTCLARRRHPLRRALPVARAAHSPLLDTSVQTRCSSCGAGETRGDAWVDGGVMRGIVAMRASAPFPATHRPGSCPESAHSSCHAAAGRLQGDGPCAARATGSAGRRADGARRARQRMLSREGVRPRRPGAYGLWSARRAWPVATTRKQTKKRCTLPCTSSVSLSTLT